MRRAGTPNRCGAGAPSAREDARARTRHRPHAPPSPPAGNPEPHTNKRIRPRAAGPTHLGRPKLTRRQVSASSSPSLTCTDEIGPVFPILVSTPQTRQPLGASELHGVAVGLIAARGRPHVGGSPLPAVSGPSGGGKHRSSPQVASRRAPGPEWRREALTPQSDATHLRVERLEASRDPQKHAGPRRL